MPFPEIWDHLWRQLLIFTPRLVLSLVVFSAFVVGGLAADQVIRRLGHARSIDASLTGLLAKAAKVGLVLFGAVSGLGTLGIDVSALVAGLGLTGFALGFALKDIISNALAGVLVIIYKPFRPEDRISVASFQGTVRKIDLRYTTLESDGKTIYVPNALVFSNAVTVEP